MNWSLLPTVSAPMPLQMALDELLFESQKEKPQAPVLRFYVSSEPWISVGYSFQKVTDLRKSAMIRQNTKVPVCGRITGGGCVLHGEDLIFSLCGQCENGGSLSTLGSVQSSYEMLHEAVKKGFQSAGLEPEFYEAQGKLPKGSDCFDFPVESDLSWSGKKIAGGAQKRSGGVLLHHESISIPSGVAREPFLQAVKKGLEQVLGVTIQNSDMDPKLFFAAERTQKWMKP